MMEISVIIPTFNEKDNLCHLLNSIGSLESAEIKEILVIDSPDSSDQLSLHYANTSIRILRAPVRGRASQMNYGASQATGQILYFVHADVKLPSGFAEKIIFEIKKGCFAGCFTYLFDSPSLLLKINAWFTHLPFLWCRGGDQSLFITRPLFEQVGGFDEKQIIMEDYEIILRLKKNTTFTIIHTPPLVVSARKYLTNGYFKILWANFTAMRMFLSGKYTPMQIKKVYQKKLDLKY